MEVLTLPAGWIAGEPAGIEQLTGRENLKWHKIFGNQHLLVTFDAYQDGFVVYVAIDDRRKQQHGKRIWIRDETCPEFYDALPAMVWLEIRGDSF